MSGRPLIAHVIHRLAIGGLENGLVNLVNRLPADRFRHAVVCLNGYTEFRRRIERSDVEIYNLEKRPGKDFAVYLRLWRLLRRLQPALVHTRNFGTVDMQWIAFAARVRCRVHGEHGWEATDPYGQNQRTLRIRRICDRAIHRYVALSRDIATWLSTNVGVPPKRIVQIYNGVDDERFSPRGSVAADIPWDRSSVGRPFVFGTVGRFDRVKNHEVLLEAFARLITGLPREQRTHHRLVIAGGGTLFESMHRRAAELGIEELVWMPGARDDIPQLMRSFDVFVLPSMNEGISNTILEAMSCGLPVIAARVGGNPELIEHGITGLLYDAGDESGLMQAMQFYSADAKCVASHGQAGRTRVRDHFSIQTMVNNYAQMYERLLEPDRARAESLQLSV